MKAIHYLCLLFVTTAFLFINPADAFAKNNPKKFKPRPDNTNNQDNRNNNNDNHDNNNNGDKHHYNNQQERHYRYHDQDYSFNDYYRFYRAENNGFTYEGAYGKYGDVFIFNDKYGNEFDLYIKPIDRTPRWFRGYPLQEGQSYNIRLNQTKMYVQPDQVSVGLSFDFGWGSLSMQNNKYFDMYTAPELVNIRGELFIRN